MRGVLDERDQKISKALPGWPVNVFGWKSIPHAGDVVLQVKNEVKF